MRAQGAKHPRQSIDGQLGYGAAVSHPRLFLLVVAGVFVAFLVVKSRIELVRDPAMARARRRLAAAKARARAKSGDPQAQAAAYREAAVVALEELGRPGLAASLARRADAADPDGPDSLRLLARAMRSAERHRALEKLLWQRLDAGPTEVSPQIWDELLALYDGPLRRPAQARVLRSLLGETSPAQREEE